jgi:hypothetical protein
MMDPERTRQIVRSRTTLFALLGLLGILPALWSPMMLDSPQATRNPATVLLFLSVVTFPVICFLSVLTAWPLHRRGRYSAACWVAALPAVNVAVGVVALCCLQLIYGGKFSG